MLPPPCRTVRLRDYTESVEGRLPDAMAECIGMIQIIIDDLPSENYNVLRCICDHLVQASTHEDITNMAEGNFAICFGQTILTPPDDQAAIMATGFANRFVNLLLHNVSNVILTVVFLAHPFYFFKYHAIFERDQENDADGDADEGGEAADPDTHYLEGLEEEEEGEGEGEGVSPVSHILTTTTTTEDGYGVAM